MSRIGNVVCGVLIAALLVGGPLAYVTYQRQHTWHLREVRDGVLYRSGQMSLDGLKRVVHEFGIRSVVTLRDADSPGSRRPIRRRKRFAETRHSSRSHHTARVVGVGTRHPCGTKRAAVPGSHG